MQNRGSQRDCELHESLRPPFVRSREISGSSWDLFPMNIRRSVFSAASYVGSASVDNDDRRNDREMVLRHAPRQMSVVGSAGALFAGAVYFRARSMLSP